MRKKPKIIIISVVVALIIVGIFIKISNPIQIVTQSVQKKTMIRDFKESANSKFDDNIAISAPYNAKILFVAQEGIKVKKGDLLVQLDSKDLETKKQELTANQKALTGQEDMSKPTLYKSQIDSLDVAIAMAKDNIKRAEQDEKKYKALYEKGAVAKVEYDNYARAYEDTKQLLALKESEKQTLLNQSKEKVGSKEYYQSQKNSIQVNINDIDSKIAQKNIYSQVDGIITKVNMKKGDFATNITPIMEIADKNQVTISCDVLTSDAAALKVGQNVEIVEKIGDDSTKKQGTIVDIGKFATTKISSLGLNEQRVKVKITTKELQNKIVGADMDIIFETMRLEDKIVVPKSSVFEDKENKYVWKVVDSKIEKTIIKTGRESDYEYEVISGIQEKDIVVVDPNNVNIKQGLRVKAIEKQDM